MELDRLIARRAATWTGFAVAHNREEQLLQGGRGVFHAQQLTVVALDGGADIRFAIVAESGGADLRYVAKFQ